MAEIGKALRILASILALLLIMYTFPRRNWFLIRGYAFIFLAFIGALFVCPFVAARRGKKPAEPGKLLGIAVTASILFFYLPEIISLSEGLLSAGTFPPNAAVALAAAILSAGAAAILFIPPLTRLISRNYAKLILAAVFILSLRENLKEALDSEFFWWLSLAGGRPAACFMGAWHGSEPRVGPFFSIFLNTISNISGKDVSAYNIYAAILSALCVFFIFKACKEAFGQGTAEVILGVSGITFLFPFVRILVKESSMQSFLIATFAWLFLKFRKEGGIRLLVLLSIVAGIGIQNKIFFPHLPCLLRSRASGRVRISRNQAVHFPPDCLLRRSR
ncbi:MAG: glycosyltransferase family 39 protein [archaeon]